MNGLARLKKSISMARSKRVVDLPDGTQFEWWQTPLTLSERERATKRAGKDSEDTITVALCVLIMKATDQNGQKLFQQGELVDLKTELPETVIGQMVIEVFRDSLSEEDEDGEEGSIDVSPKSSSRNSKQMAT